MCAVFQGSIFLEQDMWVVEHLEHGHHEHEHGHSAGTTASKPPIMPSLSFFKMKHARCRGFKMAPNIML